MKLVDDLIYEFKGKHVVRKDGEITLCGSNPSAEEETEGSEERVERGIDFVLNHRLQEMNCYEDMATFKAYIKEFVKKVVEYMEKNGKSKEEVDQYKKKIQTWVITLLNKDRFKNLQFFIGNCCYKTLYIEIKHCFKAKIWPKGEEKAKLLLLSTERYFSKFGNFTQMFIF